MAKKKKGKKRNPRSKLTQARLLRKNRKTKRHVPRTKRFTKKNLHHMMRRYRVLYIKPNGGGQGKGILRVKRMGKNKYQIKTRRKVILCKKKQAYSRLRRMMRKQGPYVIQRGIRSITRKNKPFDIRVFVTRIRGKWKVAGIVGKMARKNKIVTNYHAGGRPIRLNHLLKNHLRYKKKKRRRVKRKLKQLSIQAAKAMSKRYNRKAYGIDFGISRKKGKPWIYEINITPGINLFKIKRKLYRRVRLYKKMAS